LVPLTAVEAVECIDQMGEAGGAHSETITGTLRRFISPPQSRFDALGVFPFRRFAQGPRALQLICRLDALRSSLLISRGGFWQIIGKAREV